jgi:hypothetical protein
MYSDAANDSTLLMNAQQIVQSLLADYISNISSVTGVTYEITWMYVDSYGNPMTSSKQTTEQQ